MTIPVCYMSSSSAQNLCFDDEGILAVKLQHTLLIVALADVTLLAQPASVCYNTPVFPLLNSR